jgi:preprotein translocase subunit Sec61beta
MNDIGLSAEEMKSIKIDPIVSLVIVVATLVVASVMSIMMPAKENSGEA